MKSEIITLRTTPEIKEKLLKDATKQNRTLTNLIETIILEYLKEKDDKNNLSSSQ